MAKEEREHLLPHLEVARLMQDLDNLRDLHEEQKYWDRRKDSVGIHGGSRNGWVLFAWCRVHGVSLGVQRRSQVVPVEVILASAWMMLILLVEYPYTSLAYGNASQAYLWL